uniref:Exocyst complex component 5 n=1 Tax=Aegilops tauschii TaxID=37682 RepID=R7WFD0_AEGTA
MPSPNDPPAALPLTLDLEDFKVRPLIRFVLYLPSFRPDLSAAWFCRAIFPSTRSSGAWWMSFCRSSTGDDAAGVPPRRRPARGRATRFPAVDELLGLFKHSCKELVDLRRQIDKRLQNLKKEVATQDAKHRKTLGELEKGVDGLFDSFARLDSRISSVGQTAAKIGDHLQSAESQRETASQTIDLIKYLMEFNSTPGDLMELSPLFSDDSRVAEAASIAQKLRSFAEEDVGRHGVTSAVGSANASRGLEVAVANLQEYCNELENRLLSRFDTASQRRELSTMAECAKILSQLKLIELLSLKISWLFGPWLWFLPMIPQFNRGTSAMQHYVATRPMFIDVEIMNTDIQVVLGDDGPQADSSSIAEGLSILYKEIADTVRKEATTIMAVFPSPNEVMSILVQRVLEQRVTAILDKLLIRPSLASLPPVEEGGLLHYLRVLSVAYDKTEELAKELQSIGCGDLDIEDQVPFNILGLKQGLGTGK